MKIEIWLTLAITTTTSTTYHTCLHIHYETTLNTSGSIAITAVINSNNFQDLQYPFIVLTRTLKLTLTLILVLVHLLTVCGGAVTRLFLLHRRHVIQNISTSLATLVVVVNYNADCRLLISFLFPFLFTFYDPILRRLQTK